MFENSYFNIQDIFVGYFVTPISVSAFSGGSLRPPNVPTVLLTFLIHFWKGARLPSVTVSLAREGGDGAGGGCGRGYPPPMVGTFSKIRVSKLHFKALLKRFSRELNVIKIHGKNSDTFFSGLKFLLVNFPHTE